ncbi:MAG TPA: hypothetical protein VH415_14410 [Nitrososphaeraceae archaeon]|jgi:hypothetical protein
MSGERVHVIKGDQMAKITAELITKANYRVDCLFEQHNTFASGLAGFLNNLIGIKKQYIKIKLITEVTNDSLEYYKNIAKHIDIRHLDGVKGNFLICDGIEYFGYILGNKLLHEEMIHVNDESFVSAQQYIFDSLWSVAVALKDKIVESQEPYKRQFTERIAEALETQRLIMKIINSATDEILLLFSTTNSFMRAKHDGLLEMLRAASEKGVKVRVLLHIDDRQLKEKLKEELKKNFALLSVQYMSKPLEKTVTTLVRDKQACLLIKVNDDSKASYTDATVDSTYSNSDATINSCVSIFESLWIQTELESQKKVKQAYFKMFKGFELKDESYVRQWSFDSEKQEE